MHKNNKFDTCSSIGNFKTYILNLIFGFLDKEVGSWFMPFSDILVESIETVSSYVQYQLIIFTYRYALLFHCLHFCLYYNVGLWQRIIFVLYFIVVIYRLKWTLAGNNLERAKMLGIPDGVLTVLLDFIVNYNNPERCDHVSLFVLVVMAFFPTNNRTKLISMGCVGVINFLFNPTLGNYSWRFAIVHVVIYGFIIYMGYAYVAITIEFSKKLTILQKETEVKLQNNNMYIASISHDLKNPLNSILGCIDLLKNSEKLSDHEKHFLLTANYSGKIMTYLIANIVDTAKMAKGKFDIDRVPMNIAEVLDKVISIEGELAKAKNIRLHTRVLTDLPRFVYGDEMRLSQVLMNLMGNAIKFTSKGYTGFVVAWTDSIDEAKEREKFEKEVIPPEEYFLADEVKSEKDEVWNFDIEEVKDPVSEKIEKYLNSARTNGNERNKFIVKQTVSYSSSSPREDRKARPRDKVRSFFRDSRRSVDADLSRSEEKTEFDSGLLIIDVIDSGIGMSKEEQEVIFQPFTQANSSVKAKYGGTGLGLWITKQLVYLMSGFIELKSISNKGSRFTITLPFKIVRNKQQIASTFELRNKAYTHKGRYINSIAAAIKQLRRKKTLELTGTNIILDKMRILIIEDTNFPNDTLLIQVVNQIKDTDCCLTYCSYSNCVEIVKKYEFEAALVLSSKERETFIELVNTLMSEIKENSSNNISLGIATGNSTQQYRLHKSN